MAIASGSYGSVAEVVPMVRYLMSGAPTFNTSTTPTLTEVESMIDRCSAVLDMTLRAEGFTTPINTTTADATAKTAMGDWVVIQTANYVELTHPGSGFGEAEGSRSFQFMAIYGKASEFVKMMAPALINYGATQTRRTGEAAHATNEDAVTSRDDPTDTTKSQPSFSKALFNNAS